MVFAAGVSHAPGSTAWPESAPTAQKDAIYAGYARIADDLAASGADSVVIFSSEHWTNFFYDHIPAFCVGRADHYEGPVEPWLRVPRQRVPGDAALAAELLEKLYEAGIDPSYSDELELDHGTMVPVHFLLAENRRPIVPVIFNTLSEPMPSADSCYRFGAAIGRALTDSDRRVAVIATGGLSHAPGERTHGVIDDTFDTEFIGSMESADHDALRALSHARMAAAGGGTHEVRAWIALAGAVGRDWRGETVAYEAVVPWATGFGLMEFRPAA